MHKRMQSYMYIFGCLRTMFILQNDMQEPQSSKNKVTHFAFCSAARLPSSRSSYILYNMEYLNIRTYVVSCRYLAIYHYKCYHIKCVARKLLVMVLLLIHTYIYTLEQVDSATLRCSKWSHFSGRDVNQVEGRYQCC